jgi:hypothetical protein
VCVCSKASLQVGNSAHAKSNLILCWNGIGGCECLDGCLNACSLCWEQWSEVCPTASWSYVGVKHAIRANYHLGIETSFWNHGGTSVQFRFEFCGTVMLFMRSSSSSVRVRFGSRSGEGAHAFLPRFAMDSDEEITKLAVQRGLEPDLEAHGRSPTMKCKGPRGWALKGGPQITNTRFHYAATRES